MTRACVPPPEESGVNAAGVADLFRDDGRHGRGGGFHQTAIKEEDRLGGPALSSRVGEQEGGGGRALAVVKPT